MSELMLTVAGMEVNTNVGPFDFDIIESLYNQYSHLLEDEPSSPTYSFIPSIRSIPIINRIIPALDEKQILIKKLLSDQKSAISYKEWFEISLKLDELLNNDQWKVNPESNLYDYELVHNNLMEMRNARISKDYKLLLYLIRTKWTRNLGNMGDINLYRHSHVGTKTLIEDYIKECEMSLDYLINNKEVSLDDRYLLGMLIQTRKNIGRTALVLSGGSTFGIFHIGVVITLLESSLLPRIISGSSAGSIIASIICSHSNEETVSILNDIMVRRFDIFESGDIEKEKDGESYKKVLKNLSHLLKYGTLFDIDSLQNTMIGLVGDLTFREAYNRTGRILNITVSPTSIHEQTRLLNYLTAPNCLIWSAVCASCSLPGVFPSTLIYEKVPNTNGVQEWNNDASMKFVDGSVDNDLPITRLLEMFNADHIIACQVNPHVVPILKVSISSIGGEVENEINYKFKNFLNNCYDFMTSEIIHYLQILNEMDVYKTLSNKLITLISQHYSGDITILPDFKSKDFFKVFKNPTPAFLLDFIIRGARASWPKVTVIYNHCGVEFALDKAISLLRGRLITTNNKLTYRTSNSTNNNVNQNITLVNLPVMNYDDSISSPVTPEKSRINSFSHVPPNIKRHNSASSSIGLPTNTNRTPAFKRNSISVAVPSTHKATDKLLKGRSTTSLASLSSQYSHQNSSISAETTLINDDDRYGRFAPLNKRLEKHHSFPDNIKNPSGYSEDNESNGWKQEKDRHERQKVRKAKSSGNFHIAGRKPDPNSQKLKYQTERIPFYKGNPYLDASSKHAHFDFVGPKECAENVLISETDNNMEKEKPNLPKLSNNNSLKNSYIGLNRLKDNYLSRSNNNSNYNLKDVYNSDLIKTRLMNLHSPDLRRSFSKSYLNDNKYSQVFNTTDNEEESEELRNNELIPVKGDVKASKFKAKDNDKDAKNKINENKAIDDRAENKEENDLECDEDNEQDNDTDSNSGNDEGNTGNSEEEGKDEKGAKIIELLEDNCIGDKQSEGTENDENDDFYECN